MDKYLNSMRDIVLKTYETDMRGKETDIRNNVVVKSNDIIIKGRFSLSTQQQKILLYIISQIEKDDDIFKYYTFNIREFCEITNIDKESGNNYAKLKQQIKEIADKSMWVKTENGETLLRWIEKPYIDKNSGVISIRLDRDMKPYLLQLKNNFTQYDLIYPLSFNSKYSIRLYEILKAILHRNNDYFEKLYLIDELKELLDCKNYTTFKDFNSRVLQPAKKEINTNSDLLIEYEFIKNSRKIQYIRIHIYDKTDKQTTEVKRRLLKETYPTDKKAGK